MKPYADQTAGAWGRAPDLFWYCAEVDSSRLHWARRDLDSLGFTTFQPTCLEKRFRLRWRRHETVEAALFPGYLFVRYDPYRQIFQEILKARGVEGLIKGAGMELPARVNSVAMQRLLELAKDGPVRDERWMSAFAPQTEVKVTKDGAWQGWTGKVQRSAKERVWVLMQLFGTVRPVEFPAAALEAV